MRAVPSALLIVLLLAACGSTFTPAPVTDRALAGLHRAHFPVYWLGRSDHGLTATSAGIDPGGAAEVTYGACVVGGGGTCVHPVLVVTAPDNSFIPGVPRHGRHADVRDRDATVGEGGRVIEIPTGSVVVDVLATTPRLARTAARDLRPLGSAQADGPLPPPSGPSGFVRSSSG